jgi:hypothetical protein
MKPLVVGAMRPLFLILLALAAGFGASHPAGATHPIFPHWWWLDLKPWGEGRISYVHCAIPYELPPEWEQGVEGWDALMTDFMDFDLEPGGCYAAGEVHLGWDLENRCPQGAFACAVPMSYVNHGGLWWEMKKVYIYFDHDLYYNLEAWQELWQVAIPAHEWGHVLNLEDHDLDQCAENLIMGQVDPSLRPCLLGPTAAEVDAVIMNYGLLDSDGDDFEDAVEWYLGTSSLDNCACGPGPGGDPWPPDIDMSCDISVTGDIFN